MSYSAYLGSDVLRDPNPLSVTISLSGRAPELPNGGRPSRQCSVAACERGGKFLYKLLQTLRDSQKFPVLNAFGANEIAENLFSSWDAYTRLEWPFSNYTSSVPILDWWAALSETGFATVLSVSILSPFLALSSAANILFGQSVPCPIYPLPYAKFYGGRTHGFSSVMDK